MSNADIRGRFVWHELMTTDTKAASAFYSKVGGWRTQAWDKDPSYTLWVSAKGGGPFGGVRTLPDAARAAGPHWLAYIGTDDVDGTVQTAQRLGARVTMGATDIPDAGRMAVLADPQGAAFALYSSAGASQSSSSSPPSQEFSWHELSTSDTAGALRFYTELFGWAEVGTHDMGAMGVYHLLGLQGVPSIGMFKIPADKPMPTQWMCYAHVADVDRSANAGKAAGGKLLNGPMEVPGGTWIAQFMDPQGAMFAIHADKRAVAATPAAQPAKAPTPRTAAAKSTSGSVASPAHASAPTATPAKLKSTATAGAAQSARATKSAALKKTPAKKAAAKKAPAKAALKRAARKATKKKAVTKRRPKRRSSLAAKRSTRKSATKRKATRKRGKAGRRRSATGGFTVGSLLRRLRGRKRR